MPTQKYNYDIVRVTADGPNLPLTYRSTRFEFQQELTLGQRHRLIDIARNMERELVDQGKPIHDDTTHAWPKGILQRFQEATGISGILGCTLGYEPNIPAERRLEYYSKYSTNYHPTAWVAVIRSEALRDTQLCTNAEHDPMDDDAWTDANELEGYLGIFHGCYDMVLAEAAGYGTTCSDNIRLIPIRDDDNVKPDVTDPPLVFFECQHIQDAYELSMNAEGTDAIACAAIDGYPSDENASGAIVCNIYMTPSEGFIIDWHRGEYKNNIGVMDLIASTKALLKEQYGSRQ